MSSGCNKILVLFILWVVFIGCTQCTEAQTGPVLKQGNVLIVYIGKITPETRVYLDTTASNSPNADIEPPFDEVGEAPYEWYFAAAIEWRGFGEEGSEEFSGWVAIPLPGTKIEIPYGSGNWQPDSHMRVIVHTDESTGCYVVVCGGKLVVTRTDLSTVQSIPRRRAVEALKE